MNATDVRQRLTQFYAEPPPELVRHFVDAAPRRADALGINLLDLEESIQQTVDFRDIPIGESMGLVILEDANNSNPYCYVSRGPARGTVLYLCHDGDSEIRFSSLQEFDDAIDDAIKRRIHILDFPAGNRRPVVSQDELTNRIYALCGNDSSADHECELLILIALLETERTELVIHLATHGDFIIREAAAVLISKFPQLALLDTVNDLSQLQNL